MARSWARWRSEERGEGDGNHDADDQDDDHHLDQGESGLGSEATS
jgi:hypothetical protein